jgi:hypothetical protein
MFIYCLREEPAMKRCLFATVCAWLTLVTAGHAAFVENFDSYVPGLGVAAQSAGKWVPWPGAPVVDALVTSDPLRPGNALNITDNPAGTPDVVAATMSDIFLTGPNQLFSFDVLIHGTGDFLPQINLGSWTAVTNGTYSGVLLNFVNYPGAGDLLIQPYGGGAGGGGAIATGLAPDQWHHIDLFLHKVGNQVNVASVANGVPGATAFVTLAYPDGFSTIELGTYTPDNVAGTYVLVDNIDAHLIPEPSTLALAALGLLGLTFFGRRRRKR